MNRDSTIIQAAILLIIIAILGVAIVKKQRETQQIQSPPTITQQPSTSTTETGQAITTGSVATGRQETETPPAQPSVEPAYANIVREYFTALGGREFQRACSLLSPAKCASNRAAAVEAFSQEYRKLANGYEYLSVQDYGDIAPSGKRVVCVKYTYRYIDHTNPQPISEIMSFYVDQVENQLKITDRVCEKKYKEGQGVRPCPVQANQQFCVGKIK
jgi:predicted lipid-binding transport protein (Tim44 family)